MKIDDLILLLNNRLREFKLSGDYARMNGDLERMNAADKEVLALEDTLYKLNLLVDTSKSAAIKDAILAEVMMDGSVAVLGEYDISSYATDPKHEEKIMNILSKMGVMDTVEKIDDYIKDKYLSSPVTGEMIMSAALAYIVDARLMMAIMEQDSRFGTAGIAVRTLNPGNVGNNDAGDTVTYESWQEGVTAVAEWLNRHRISKIISEIPEETITELTATSTPPIITPTATSTPVITTSTTTTTTATSTPATATTTPATATSTPVTATSTPATTTTATTPVTATSTPETIPVITSTTTTATSTPTTATTTPATSTLETLPVITSTTTTATTTPVTATSTPTTATTTPTTATSTPAMTTSTPATATTTPVTATSTEETIPVVTSTTTTTTATSTDSTGSSQATTTQQTATSTAN